MALGGDLRLNRLDLDPYLPSVRGRAAVRDLAKTPLTPVSHARELTVDGRLRVDSLHLRGVRAHHLETRLQVEKGHVRLHPLKAPLFQGAYRGDLRVDASGTVPRLTVDERARGLQVGPLQRDLLGEVMVTGTARMDLALRARGRTLGDVLRSLSGRGAYGLEEGEVMGMGLRQRVLEAVNPFGDGEEGGVRTWIHALHGSLEIREGRAYSNDLEALVDLVHVAGHGYVAPGERRRMDYRLDMALRGEAEGIPDLVDGLVVPVRFHGPLAQPEVELKVGEALKGELDPDLEDSGR
ncbi:AsmA family protein [Thiohalorhabdus sp. Cl-TMA]|uniref:AsmA family protein n=1 Tax=Thiohalorhabdus methylotrophus TaxID=3242694 RepID=A0ABV4TQS3_9GAMM